MLRTRIRLQCTCTCSSPLPSMTSNIIGAQAVSASPFWHWVVCMALHGQVYWLGLDVKRPAGDVNEQRTGRRLCSTTWSYVASSMKPGSGEKALQGLSTAIQHCVRSEVATSAGMQCLRKMVLPQVMVLDTEPRPVLLH